MKVINHTPPAGHTFGVASQGACICPSGLSLFSNLTVQLLK